MLPPFYQAHLQQCLSPRHYLLVNLLVLLLQWHKQVRLERLAATLPLPIQFEGRRRCLQRLLASAQLHIDTLWLPLVGYLLSCQFRVGQTLYLALDRTQWQGVNVLMVSVIYRGRALPL
ncbi:MAG TPA: IS4 family transposase, partial [Candidatus Obscuribacterales bacterium]